VKTGARSFGHQYLGDELAGYPTAHQPPTLTVAVEGQTRELHTIARDEIYKVAAEALRNAYRHADASRIEVEIRYDSHEFRLRVRDDGKGIDGTVLAAQGLVPEPSVVRKNYNRVDGRFGLTVHAPQRDLQARPGERQEGVPSGPNAVPRCPTVLADPLPHSGFRCSTAAPLTVVLDWSKWLTRR
jgi:hypothetical protein